jgi:predicted ATP-dependent protease
MQQANYNLFVLGEVGSGRSSLLKQAMTDASSTRPASSDLCYLHNFAMQQHPIALRLPAGQGRLLRQLMTQLGKTLQMEIPAILIGQEFKAESGRLEKDYKTDEARAYAALDAFAEERHFVLHRESGQLVFTLIGDKSDALTEHEVYALPKERRAQIDQDEQELRARISEFIEKTRPLERAMNEALVTLQHHLVQPLLEREIQQIKNHFTSENISKLDGYFEQLMRHVLENIKLFEPSEMVDNNSIDKLNQQLARYQVNLVVDHSGQTGAPVIIENNPLYRSLYGSIEYYTRNEVLATDFSCIRAGSLLRAHGGFLMLHLRDLRSDELVWEKLRRFLRSGKLQIEEPGTAFAPIAAVSLEPEALDVDVKIILIASREEYYEMQALDAEFVRRFQVKVDFAESFASCAKTHHDFAVFIAHSCHNLALPHFSAVAVVRLMLDAHRAVEDQFRQSANFARTQALIMESAAFCQGKMVEAIDVENALAARTQRHDYPAQRMQESIIDGELLISVQGEKIGQINALTVIDLGDHCFGFPVRVTARSYAGNDGLLNIEREVEMSGPVHDKGVFILQNYLSALFSHIAPLALNASLVFEQEYFGVEGDSASCAELYVLLSALSGLPLKQGIAVTGAVNQHGEVLPVGGINEKIEGYFRVCQSAGLDGCQGVLIPSRNLRHLMLNLEVRDAVEQGLFHIYAVEQITDGFILLMEQDAGEANEEGDYPSVSVLGRAQRTLQSYRRACLASEHPKPQRKHLR